MCDGRETGSRGDEDALIRWWVMAREPRTLRSQLESLTGWRGLSEALKHRFLHHVLCSREHCVLFFIVQMSHGSVMLLGKYLRRTGKRPGIFLPGERETGQTRRDKPYVFVFRVLEAPYLCTHHSATV